MQNLLHTQNIKNIAGLLKRHAKEKLDMILEPMQVMVQLAILSFSPLGTKISIHDNIVILQPPTTTQGIIRWYNNDSKDDLYYLFRAVTRFYKLYRSFPQFNYILDLAKKGLEQLIQTYSNTEKTSITQTLGLYKALLNSDPSKIFQDDPGEIEDVYQTMTEIYETKRMKVIFNTLKLIEDEENPNFKEHYINSLLTFFQPTNQQIRTWVQQKIAS